MLAAESSGLAAAGTIGGIIVAAFLVLGAIFSALTLIRNKSARVADQQTIESYSQTVAALQTEVAQLKARVDVLTGDFVHIVAKAIVEAIPPIMADYERRRSRD